MSYALQDDWALVLLLLILLTLFLTAVVSFPTKNCEWFVLPRGFHPSTCRRIYVEVGKFEADGLFFRRATERFSIFTPNCIIGLFFIIAYIVARARRFVPTPFPRAVLGVLPFNISTYLDRL